MSMPPDLEKQQPPEDPGEFVSQAKCLANSEARQVETPLLQNQSKPGPIPDGGTKRAQPVRKPTMFGLKKSTSEPHYDPIPATYDYTVKYKPDPLFHELDNNARVWHVYNDEAAIFDAEMIEEASDSLDILLVFAGLFSAVLTTFLVQTSQSLAPSDSAFSVALLKELIELQRAQAKGISFESIPGAKSAEPSVFDKWVNGLWFASLTLSLSSALIAVLVKQWLRQYRSRTTGTPRNRALLRQFRFNNFERWQVQPIIGLLPTVLHVALFLFLVGLVLFLTSLNVPMAAVIGVMTFLLLATYVATIILPTLEIRCPYRTPIGNLIARIFGRHDGLKGRESSYIELWEDSVHEALHWLHETASNASIKPILDISRLALWRFDYRRFGFGSTLFTSEFNDLVPSRPDPNFIFPLMDGEDTDWTQLSPEEARDLQSKLLFYLLHPGDLRMLSSVEYFAKKEIKALRSDPGPGILALACGFNVQFLSLEDSSPGDSAVHVSSKQAFSWLLNNHSKLTTSEIHPAVWETLKEKDGWKFQDISLDNINTELKALIKESWYLNTTEIHPHQPMSLSMFMKEQILQNLIDNLFGGSVLTMINWLNPAPIYPAEVQADVDYDGRSFGGSSGGGSPENQAIHSDI